MTFKTTRASTIRMALGATALTLIGGVASADQVIADDLIVQGSICAGFDCVNGESFGFDTLRLKENNLRIRAFDTSSSASFPTVDWQITFNDTTNGGANKFSIDNIDSGRTPFTIRDGAKTNALFIDSNSRIGIGTGTPVVNLHIVTGNTPTLRLDQDGSQGFTPQVWDVAGNEANFFIRDATNGSTLPFRLYPGSPSNALSIANDGDVFIGLSPSSNSGDLVVGGTGNKFVDLASTDNGAVQYRLVSTGANRRIVAKDSDAAVPDGQIQFLNNSIVLIRDANNQMATFSNTGLAVTGDITSTGTTVVPDYVFAPDYQLMPLAEVESFIAANQHLPRILSAAEVAEKGLNMTQMQMALLEKVEELTLYTLDQQKMIDALKQRLDMQ